MPPIFKLNKETKQFVLSENQNSPSLESYVQSLKEIIYSLTPRTKTEARRLEIAKSHLKEIRVHTKRLREQNNDLQEKLNLLEEGEE
tara:strand:+ start:102 stop:362 length:261 start_codon:yes stop_codon:yes gene_type:complete